MPSLNVWVADTSVGVAPIYADQDFARLVDTTSLPGRAFVPLPPPAGHQAEWMDAGARTAVADPSSPYAITLPPDISGLGGWVVIAPGSALVIHTASGGSEAIDYRKDGSTGLWVPAAAQGFAKPSTSLFDQLIEAGAIIGAVIATAGATGILGPTTAGPGAEAIGGSESFAAGGAASTGADISAGAATSDLTSPVSTAPPSVPADFTPPPVTTPSAIDVAPPINIAPTDVAQLGANAAAGATNPVSQVFSISKYIQSLAGAYKTVVSLGAGLTHPQAGTTAQLPDGSVSRINPDGSTTVILVNGTQTTVGPGGTVASSSGSTGILALIAAGIGAYLLS